MKDALIAIDQGTTGTTVLVLDRQLQLLGRSYREIPQHYPEPGWVSHDPESIWSSVLDGCREALQNADAERMTLEKRLEDEASSADFIRVNEDLKRLLVVLKRKK